MKFEKTHNRLTFVADTNGSQLPTVEVRAVPKATPENNIYGSWVRLADPFSDRSVAHELHEWDPKIGNCEPNFLEIMKRHHDLYVLGVFEPAGRDVNEVGGLRFLAQAIGGLEEGLYSTPRNTWYQIPIQHDKGVFVWEYNMAGTVVTARRKRDGSVFTTEIEFSKENYKYTHPLNEAFDPEAFSSVVEKVRYDGAIANPIDLTELRRIYLKLHP